MHTGQLFPAVCFWKNLIPDAVKYWFSLTSVLKSIFLSRLNNLSNKIFFWPFWASRNDLTRTLSFHIAWHWRVFVHAFLLSPTYGCCCCHSKSLELGFITAARGATMMIVEIDSPTFPLLRLLFVERVQKWRSPRARWKNGENVLASANEIHANFLLFFLIPKYGKCSIALFIVASMSAWFDNRRLSPSISHSSSMSLVLEC